MRHAIMAMGSGNDARVLQKVINHLDDSDIDFFIHWDLKYKIPKLVSQKSHVFFTPRIKVYWGTSTQISAEKILLESVWHYKQRYDYIHLISSNDIPLMTTQYFKEFFNKDLYLGYSPRNEENTQRLSFYYPIDHFNIRDHLNLIRFIKLANTLLHVNRLKKKNIIVEKGTNWFSIRSTFLPIILSYKKMKIFKHSFLGDETFLQTILSNYRPKQLKDDNEMAARYIDWQRGKPYTFTEKDVLELKKVVNTNFAFARKVKDPNLIDEIFNDRQITRNNLDKFTDAD